MRSRRVVRIVPGRSLGTRTSSVRHVPRLGVRHVPRWGTMTSTARTRDGCAVLSGLALAAAGDGRDARTLVAAGGVGRGGYP